jgi:hypothetical protein
MARYMGLVNAAKNGKRKKPQKGGKNQKGGFINPVLMLGQVLSNRMHKRIKKFSVAKSKKQKRNDWLYGDGPKPQSGGRKRRRIKRLRQQQEGGLFPLLALIPAAIAAAKLAAGAVATGAITAGVGHGVGKLLKK